MGNTSIEEFRDKALGSLYFFDRYVLGFNSTNYNPHIGMEDKPHKELCDFVQDWSSGKKNKLILIPRKCLKTSCITVGNTLFELANDPSMTVVIDCVQKSLAIKMLGQIRDICETNEVFKATFGEWKAERGWTDFSLTISTATKGREFNPSVAPYGMDSSRVSYHPKLMVIDDLVDPDTVATPESLRKAIRHYTELVPMVGEQGRKIVIGTRQDMDDLYSYILENELDDFDVFIRSAINDDGSLYYPEMLSMDFLKKVESAKPYFFACLPGDAPILMSDWTEKAISEIRVGDEVIGWTKRGIPKGKKSSLTKSRVVATNNRRATLIEIKLASGRKVYCTPKHRWYRNPCNPTKYLYRSAEVGGQMMFIYRQAITSSFTDREKIDLGWLGGIFDGEGSGDIATIRIAQSKQHNPDICKKIEEVLTHFKFRFGYNEGCGVYWINGGKWERTRFLFLINPVRKNRIIKTLLDKRDFIQEKDEVVEIIPLTHPVDVYNIQTETHNYIAYGYGSRNCQYMNDPINPSATMFSKDDIEWYEDNKELPVERTNYMTVDPAGHEGSVGDNTAIILAGVDKTQNIYFYEPEFDRFDLDQIISAIFSKYLSYKIRKIGIEQNYFRGALASAVTRRGIEWGTKPRIELLKHYGRTERKEDRIRALQPWFADGKIFLKGKKEKVAGKEQWIPVGKNMKQLYQQIISYPRAKMSDDLIDAAAMLLEIIKPAGGLDPNKVKVAKPIDKVFGY